MSETIKVRICVAVDKERHIEVAGCDAYDDDDLRCLVLDEFEKRNSQWQPQIVWVEAEVPLPTETTVQGKVTLGESE